jgi:tetratricopeptide (TPR) repeat protein
MYQLNRYTPDGVRKGLAYLQQAVELDPEDPLAYAGLAQGYTLIGHSANPPPGTFARAREAAVRALALDPLFPEAHAAMAEIQLYYDWDWDGAETSFRRALQLNPNLEFTHAHYAWLHQLLGQTDASLEHMARAQQIAPVTPIFSAWLGWLYWGAGQPDRNPRLGDWGLGLTYAQMGRLAEAHEAAARLAENPGQKDLLVLGLIHAILGERDEAIRWLAAAREAHVDWFPFIATRTGYDHFVGAAIDSLRNDPRYVELTEPLGIP